MFFWRAVLAVAAAVPAIVSPAARAQDDPCDPAWHRRTIENRYLLAMAYDSDREVTVLFGGGVGAPLGDTWEFDGAEWVFRTTDGPSPRWGHAMAYDEARGVTVLFGGFTDPESDDASPNGETWEWDGQAWTLRSTTGPSPRGFTAMAYDSARGVAVLFGGLPGRDPFDSYADTWEWDGAQWTERPEPAPLPLFAHAMAYDPVRGVTLVSGLSQTWGWDGKSWTELSFSGPPHDYGSMAFDTARRVAVFRGDGFTAEWDGQVWITRAGSLNSSMGATVYDKARGQTVYFGGFPDDSGWTRMQNDTWGWDGVAWTRLAPASPVARSFHAMAYDSQRGVVVLHGGWPRTLLGNETWEWNGLDWSLRSTAGPMCHQHALAYDEGRGVTVMLADDGDTWEWDGANWSRVATAGPRGGLYPSMVYDSARGVTVLTIERAPTGVDTWEWDGAAWTLRDVSGLPYRSRHAMAFDRWRGVTVLFGGTNGQPLGDTWEWDGAAWSLRATTGPAPRGFHAMAFDDSRGRTLLFGGTESDGTWEWDGTQWHGASDAGPLNRSGSAAVYDARRRAAFVFGGVYSDFASDAYRLADAWEWRPAGSAAFSRYPSDLVVAPGNPAVLTAAAEGPGVLSYQWRHNGAPLADGDTISGAATPVLTISPAASAHAGDYDVAVTSECGMILSDAALLTIGPCRADVNADGQLTAADYIAFRSLYLASDSAADFSGNGTLGVEDFSSFRSAYLAGCP